MGLNEKKQGPFLFSWEECLGWHLVGGMVAWLTLTVLVGLVCMEYSYYGVGITAYAGLHDAKNGPMGGGV